MLTSANVTAKMAGPYYDAENYYTKGEALAPSLWFGQFARDLGLEGEVAQADFEKLLRGISPLGKNLVANAEALNPTKNEIGQEIRAEMMSELRKFGVRSEMDNSVGFNGFLKNVEKKMQKGELTSKTVKRMTGKAASILERETALSGTLILQKKEELFGILQKVSAKRERRAGLDLTFSAPKSVSLQALVFGDTRLIEAHRQAVTDTLASIERDFSQCRVGSDRSERVTITSGKLAIAQFEHDLSREMDPHLHTHNVVLNLTHDGKKVRALHNDKLYQHKRLLGTMYQNELALNVRKLGYDISLGKNGTFEISGFSREQIEAFSKRHQDLWKQNVSSQSEVRELFYEGRKTKSSQIDRQQLKADWKKTADIISLEKIAIADVETKVQNREITIPLNKQVEALTEKSVAITLKDLQISHLGANLGRIETQKALDSARQYASRNLLSSEKIGLFTTKQALAKEHEYLKNISNGLKNFEPVLDNASAKIVSQALLSQNQLPEKIKALEIQQAIERIKRVVSSSEVQGQMVKIIENLELRSEKLAPNDLLILRRQMSSQIARELKGKAASAALSEILRPLENQFQAMTKGQVEAITKTLVSKDQYIVWQGVAGAGKTFSMAEVVKQLKANGHEIVGLAPSAAAAKQLGKDAKIDAGTLDGFLLNTRQVDQKSGSQKAFWIVDEAGMMSASQFEKLSNLAEKNNARVLLSGDVRQLAPVEAGNPFLDIQKAAPAIVVHLDESVRQRNPKLQEAVIDLYEGKAKIAVQGLVRQMIELDTMEERCTAVAQEYLKRGQKERDNIIVLAKTNRERELVTQGIREGLKKEGLLGNETTMRVLKNVDLTAVAKTVAYSYEPNMVLKFADQSIKGISRDHAYKIKETNEVKNTLTLTNSKGTEIKLNCSQLSSASVFREFSIPVATGDKLQWTRNERSESRLNNDAFKVVLIEDKSAVLERQDGKQFSIDLHKAHHTDHAWAVTVHKSQGQTAREVLQVVDRNTTAAELLVGITRATHEVTLFVHDKIEVSKLAERAEFKERAQDIVNLLGVGITAKSEQEKVHLETHELAELKQISPHDEAFHQKSAPGLNSARFMKSLDALFDFDVSEGHNLETVVLSDRSENLTQTQHGIDAEFSDKAKVGNVKKRSQEIGLDI